MNETKKVVVQKYGGSSVATTDKLQRVAELVVERKRAGCEVVVVVSAMGDTTDELLAKAHSITAEPDSRELDMLLTVGERISMSLLAMAIRARGLEAVSLTGSQSGIITTASHTNARIMEVRPFRIEDELELGRVVIVAGYQGVSYKRDITTLGRGGTDTTAVALAAALDAEACEIYSDVDGVFSADPRVVPDARRLDEIGYGEMLAMAASGAQVLNATAVEFAKKRGIAIYARKTGAMTPGTVVRRDAPAAPSGVRAVAHRDQIGWIETNSATSDRVRQALSTLDEMSVRPLSVTSAPDSGVLACAIGLEDTHNEAELGAALNRGLGARAYRNDRGTASLIGDGVGCDPKLASRGLDVLHSRGLGVVAVLTAPGSTTFVVDGGDAPAAARALHTGFRLHDPSVEAVLS